MQVWMKSNIHSKLKTMLDKQNPARHLKYEEKLGERSTICLYVQFISNIPKYVLRRFSG